MAIIVPQSRLAKICVKKISKETFTLQSCKHTKTEDDELSTRKCTYIDPYTWPLVKQLLLAPYVPFQTLVSREE